MAYSNRTIGIIAASILAMLFMVVAVALSGPLPFHLGQANAASTHDLLVQYAAKDTDGDGLPDWEEALYATDPNNPHSIRADVSDGDAVAQGLVSPKFATATTTPIDLAIVPGRTPASDTLTDQFSRSFFESYFRARGASATPPTQADLVSFVEGQLATLEASQAAHTTFTAAQVRVSGVGSDALAAYAGDLETILAKDDAYDKNELYYYSDAVLKDDPAAFKAVAGIAKEYQDAARAVLALPVPVEAKQAHLDLANALYELGDVLTDMGTLDADPLRAMVGIDRYSAVHNQLMHAFVELHDALATSGATPADGTPGSRVFKLGTPTTQP